MMCYSVMTQAYSEKEIPSSPDRNRTRDLTSSDALQLSYRRLVGAKAIKLGSGTNILQNKKTVFAVGIQRYKCSASFKKYTLFIFGD